MLIAYCRRRFMISRLAFPFTILIIRALDTNSRLRFDDFVVVLRKLQLPDSKSDLMFAEEYFGVSHTRSFILLNAMR